MNANNKEFPKDRVVSIDVLRGFDMFWIIGGGSVFIELFTLSDNPFMNALVHQFHHSQWNGFTFEDLIFPLFLFIVGLSIPFSLTKRIDRGDSNASLYRHIITRTLVLIFLGLIYNGILGFEFHSMRFVGVLQRIALCYLFTSLIVMNTGIRGQVIWTISILIGYWAVMKLVPVPGFGAGVLTPEGNFASWIDRLFLPGRFCCFEFGDNEGLLSTVPAVSTTLLGVLSGQWITSRRTMAVKFRGLLIAGIICLVGALIWNVVFPINKLLWTSSFVLFAGGWSLLVFATFYWIIDVKRWKRWAFPFFIIGLNPITIYIAQELFDFGMITNVFIHGFAGHLGALEDSFSSLSVLIVKWLFLYFLYRQRIFLKV
jgi:predicted acyltransferase